MSRPRPSRWLSIPDVTDIILRRSNSFAERLRGRPRKRQLEAVRRLVLRAEERDDARFTKRVSGDIYVRFDALESLLSVNVESITRLEVALVDVATETKKIWKHVGGHGSRLREHEKRIVFLEEEQALTTKYLADMQALRSRTKAAS